MNENISPLSGESMSLSGEGYPIPDNSETIESMTVESGSSYVIVEDDTVSNIYADVHIMLVLSILTFAMACMRGWRKNSLRGC